MKDLSPVARTLLERARDAGAPNAAAKARVEHALAARLASPLGASALAGAGKAALGMSVTTKGLVVAGLAGIATLAGLELATPVVRDASKATPSMPTHEAPVILDRPLPASSAEGARATDELPPAVTASGTRRRAEVNGGTRSVESHPTTTSQQHDAPRGSSPVRVADFGSAASEPAEERGRVAVERAAPSPYGVDSFDNEHDGRGRPPVKGDLLAAETQSLREIQSALREGNGQLALELISMDRARYAKGVLHQERAAARIQALCLLGQADSAQKEAATFEEKWPRSPLLARVRSACR